MKDRIRQIRKALKLTQAAFADAIALKQNTIATFEMGRTSPSDRTITDICRKFNVNERWLRYGEGEMFRPRSRNEIINDYLNELNAGKRTDIEQLLIEFMAETSVDEWIALSKSLKRLTEKMNGAAD